MVNSKDATPSPSVVNLLTRSPRGYQRAPAMNLDRLWNLAENDSVVLRKFTKPRLMLDAVNPPEKKVSSRREGVISWLE
jgi:hypothetical protein